jgi:hypothetical protein
VAGVAAVPPAHRAPRHAGRTADRAGPSMYLFEHDTVNGPAMLKETREMRSMGGRRQTDGRAIPIRLRRDLDQGEMHQDRELHRYRLSGRARRV